jgi:DNA-directed RNA polymerase specialized sigma24 family protein
MDRHEQIDALYRETHGRLRRIVSAAANTTTSNVDDACAFAWSQLTRRPHLDAAASAGITRWLATTATREAIRLDRLDRRCEPLHDHDFRRPGDLPSASAALESREAVQELLAPATDRQRRLIIFVALGLSYREMAAAEGSTHRTVDRQLHRGRERIRRAHGPRSPRR